MQLKSVVLPAPFDPRTARRSPGRTVKRDVCQGGESAEQARHATQLERVGRADRGEALSDAIHGRRPMVASAPSRLAIDCAIAPRGR